MTTELNALEIETREALTKAAEEYKNLAYAMHNTENRDYYLAEARKLYELDGRWAARIVDNERRAGVYYKTTAEALEAHTARVVGMVEESLAKPDIDAQAVYDFHAEHGDASRASEIAKALHPAMDFKVTPRPVRFTPEHPEGAAE